MVEPINGWQAQANCKSTDNDLFFSDNKKDQQLCKSICSGCPVSGECLEYALVYNMHGSWGGKTQKERSRISRRNIQILRDDLEESGMYNPKLKV
jgi:WhiB family redox-sensing transcriptional regulator